MKSLESIWEPSDMIIFQAASDEGRNPHSAVYIETLLTE